VGCKRIPLLAYKQHLLGVKIPGGEASVALTGHWVTCGSKPGVGG